MIYADTSVLVAALVAEDNTDRVQAWLASMPPMMIVVSGWTSVEVSSALARKARMGELDDILHRDALATWQAMFAGMLVQSAITTAHFDAAAQLVDRYRNGIRPGDALHLAIASDQQFRFATFDLRLAEAARGMGIMVEPV